MALTNDHHHLLSLIFGVLGNVVSFMVYLAPLPTFIRIYKKKSTEGFQSIPYAVALFSAMLLLYYAFVKLQNGFMLLTINSIGCAIEGLYLTMYLIYAPKKAKVYTMKLLILFNAGVYGLIVLSTMLVARGAEREKIVGWICAIFSVCVFASPLSIMRLVIKTKSVEFMPFLLSFCLTLCAVFWFFYGFLIGDFFIALPNVLGFVFGMGQMILYIIYKDSNKKKQLEVIKPTDIGLETIAIDIKPSSIEKTEINSTADDKKPEIENNDNENKMLSADDYGKANGNTIVAPIESNV